MQVLGSKLQASLLPRTGARSAFRSAAAPGRAFGPRTTYTPVMASAAAPEAPTKWTDEETNKSCRGRSTMGVFVNSNYDSGNIDVINITNPRDHTIHEVELKIHPDPLCDKDKREHMQWFYFRVSNALDETLNCRIINAGQASFPRAWRGYNVCASYDRRHWFRVPTEYDGESGVLSWTHTPERGACYYAYFAPFSYEQHQDLVAEMQCHDNVTLEMLGETLDGHDIDLLRIGEDIEGKRKIWVLARQHPGESMAEYFAEGLLRRLVDPTDPTSRKLLRDCVFYVVPCMCPDGVFRGHLRTNAAGANLNREWAAPSMDVSPEVFLVRNEMDDVGVDMLVDVHGDEELPYNFIVGNHGVPSWDDKAAALFAQFSAAFCAASPDFQSERGYGTAPPNSANLSLCSKQVGERFKCLSVTLEQPFKDNADLPERKQGWSPERSRKLGAAMLDAVLAVVPKLR
ncbi:hypothetical protein D9Q98_004638 [Chlorella vulgaris]|uniref:Peptidase M14 domain-containing protein n=1 Tax=Chlorella vulgaris TaxID=3077 RepID=A0A9D4TQB6_CHLVU|nr:hypothetical protein D9Q98_004638 [Chlorella vulgaris]